MKFDLPKPEIIAKGVQPEAALAFWQARAAITREQAMNLKESECWRAFVVAGLTRLDHVQAFYDAISNAIQDGTTFEDFKADTAAVAKVAGINGQRLKTIFQTNMHTAYAAGRYVKMQQVKATRPYWQYLTTGDRRVRPSHAVLHGLVYHADHEFWDTNFPPNGFNCHCSQRTLSERQMKREGLTAESEMPGPSVYIDPATGMEYHVASPGADKGFANNPGKDWMESTLKLATGKLEKAPPPLAAATIRTLAQGGLEQWTKNPKGNFPLAVLKKEDAAAIGATTTVAHISPETWQKQVAHHPELTLADYWLAQDAVERGEQIRQDARNMVFALNQSNGVLVVIKATMVGDELYITSLRRMSGDSAERERTLKKLRKR